jgi:hypothetical protein
MSLVRYDPRAASARRSSARASTSTTALDHRVLQRRPARSTAAARPPSPTSTATACPTSARRAPWATSCSTARSSWTSGADADGLELWFQDHARLLLRRHRKRRVRLQRRRQGRGVYSDEYHLWMYDGLTGENLIGRAPATPRAPCGSTRSSPTSTTTARPTSSSPRTPTASPAPTTARSSRASASSAAPRLSWVRTRRVWNQHTYHVTNIARGRQVPVSSCANWTDRAQQLPPEPPAGASSPRPTPW